MRRGNFSRRLRSPRDSSHWSDTEGPIHLIDLLPENAATLRQQSSASLGPKEGSMGNRGKRYTEEQIIAILKEAAAENAKVGEVLRRHGVAPKTYYS